MSTASVIRSTTPAEAREYWLQQAWHHLLPVVEYWARDRVPRLWRLSSDDVDDIVALVLVRVWSAPTPPQDPRAWVGRVTMNLARDLMRRRRRDAAGDETLAYHTATDPRDDADQWIDDDNQRARRAHLRAALQQLPDANRRCLVLRYLHQRTHRQIAEICGITVAASKMRTYSALKHLTALYQHGRLAAPISSASITQRARLDAAGMT